MAFTKPRKHTLLPDHRWISIFIISIYTSGFACFASPRIFCVLARIYGPQITGEKVTEQMVTYYVHIL